MMRPVGDYKKLKTKFLLPLKRRNVSTLWSVSGNLRLASLRNDLAPDRFLFVLAPNPEMVSVTTGRSSGENEVDF